MSGAAAAVTSDKKRPVGVLYSSRWRRYGCYHDAQTTPSTADCLSLTNGSAFDCSDAHAAPSSKLQLDYRLCVLGVSSADCRLLQPLLSPACFILSDAAQ